MSAEWSIFDDEPTPEPYPEELNDSDLKKALLGKIVEGSIIWHDDIPVAIYAGLLSKPVLQNGDTISVEWKYEIT